MAENSLLNAALHYSEDLNLSVIPFKPNKPNDQKIPYLSTWTEFQKNKPSADNIRQWWTQWPDAMIAIVTGQVSNLLAIDADTKEAEEQVESLLPDNLIVPISTTPAGGKHYHFQYNPLIKNYSRTNNPSMRFHIRSEGGCIISPPSVRVDGKAYTWMEGINLNGGQFPTIPNALLYYIKEFAVVLYEGAKDEVTQSHEMFTEGSRNEDLFHIANQLSVARTPEWQIRQVLEILAQNCKPKFSKREIESVIKSVLERSRKRDLNISQDLKLWVESQEGHFKVTEYHKESQIVTKEQKHAVIQALKRLQDEGIIEKFGEQRGAYRRIEGKAEEIDFINVEEKTVDLVWPFEIETWVKILPKNIIIIAGEANAGKTAFLLNLCFMNMGKAKINYFSSEMGAMELRDRLKKFEVNLTQWKENISFKERSSNFTDVIKKDEVNVIDFLEITDEFYRVGGMIKEIYDKLRKGVAVIALQKNPGTDLGLGGMRSIEKARLYLSIESGKIKMVKGKNWASLGNPNGLVRSFRLVQGAKFIPTSKWER